MDLPATRLALFDALLDEVDQVERNEYGFVPVLDYVIEEDPDLVRDVASQYRGVLVAADGFAVAVNEYENDPEDWVPFAADLETGLPDGMIQYDEAFPLFSDDGGGIPVHEMVDVVGADVYRAAAYTGDADRFTENLRNAVEQHYDARLVGYWDQEHPYWEDRFWDVVTDTDAFFAEVFREKVTAQHEIHEAARQLQTRVSAATARERAEQYAEEFGGVSFPWRPDQE